MLHKFLNLIERLHSEYIDWPKILDVLPEAVGEHISIIKHLIDTANAPTHGHTSSTITNKYAAENAVKKTPKTLQANISIFTVSVSLLQAQSLGTTVHRLYSLFCVFFKECHPSGLPPPVEAKELCNTDWSSACGSPQISLPLQYFL